MPAIGVHCVLGNIKHDDCRSCATNPLHPCAYPADLLELMRGGGEPPQSAHSPTRIQGCARQAVLMDETDYYIDLDTAYPMARGHMVHALMESSPYPNAIASIREQRQTAVVETRFGPQAFSGKPDLVVIKELVHNVRGEQPEFYYTAKVVDYKSTSEIGHDLTEAKREHQIQVNLYAWLVGKLLLVEALPVVVDELEVIYADMKKVRRFTSAGPLQAKGKMTRRSPKEYETLDLAPIRIKDAAWCERYIRHHIERREGAKGTLPPVLEGEETWRCYRCDVYDACLAAAIQNGERTPGS